jgi:2-polyprenyl-3-methyl-5-hydroxy-6-metoxy-1,4-benzoquinol methylase
MPEHVTCNLCGADDAKVLYRARDYRLRVDERLWALVECRRCGLGYLNPRPTPDEIGVYYPDSYFAHRGDMTSRYERQAAYVGGGPGELLDIGAARGDFMRVMQRHGWNVTGIEPSTTDNPHGLDIHHERFPEECALEPARYDVVTAWAVWEHLHDPLSAFSRVAELLRPGGRFVFLVPNLRSINSRYARQEDVPRHLYMFSARTLRAYARRVGLEVAAVTHDTDLFGGSGRGVLQLGLVRGMGGSTDDFFRLYYSPRSERFRKGAVRATLWTAAGLLERVVLSDRLVRALRISGMVICTMERPRAHGVTRGSSVSST